MAIIAESFIAKFYDNSTTATVNGSVTDIPFRSIAGTSLLSAMGSWTFNITQAFYDPAFIVTNSYVRLYSVLGGVESLEFKGYLTELDFDWQPPNNGAHEVKLSLKDDLWDLAQTVIPQGEIYELKTMTPTYAGWVGGTFGSGDGGAWPNVNDNNVGTEQVFKLYDLTDSTIAANDPVFFYVGNDSPFNRVDFDFDTTINQQNTVITPNYQVYQVGEEFVGWGSATGITDTTDGGVPGLTFNQDGYIEWSKNRYEQQLNHDGRSLYWFRLYPTGDDMDNVRLRDITVEAAGPHSSDVQQVVALFAAEATGTWTLNASSETATQKTYIVTAYGDSVLAVLDDLAEKSGECFALSGTNELRWFDPASLPSSGITAEAGNANEGSTAYCHITKLRRKNSYKNKVKRVRPIGAGGDDFATVTLGDLEVYPLGGANYSFTVPSGYTIGQSATIESETSSGSNLSTWYIDNGNLTEGRTENIEFPTISPVRGGTGRNRNAADELAKAAIAYLQQNAADSEYYTATVYSLDDQANTFYPGLTMVVDADIVADDGTVTEAINETLCVVSFTKRFDERGAKYFDIKFGSGARPEPTKNWRQATNRRKKEQAQRHPQANSSAKIYGGGVPSTGYNSPGTGGVDSHGLVGTAHVTVGMTDGQVAGADGTEGTPVAITFDASDFSFNSTTNTYTVAAGAGGNVPETRTLTAGNGLTGGGDLSANRTFNVGAGDGIDVAADSVAVDVTDILGTGITEDGANNLQFDAAAVDGNGLTGSGTTLSMGTPSTLTAATTNATTASSHTHDITTASNGKTNVNTILQSDGSGNLTINDFTADNVAITSGGNVTFGADGTSEVGTSTNRAQNVHTDAIDINNIAITSDGSEVDIAGEVQTGDRVAVGDGAGQARVIIDGDDEQVKDIRYQAGSVNVFTLRVNNVAMTGSDAGNDFQIIRRSDAGSEIASTFEIRRSDGRIAVERSLVVGSPTGGDKGIGTVHAQAVYDDNTLLTDWLPELYFTGAMNAEDAEKHPDGRVWTLEEVYEFVKENFHLPTMPGRKEWEENGKRSLGQLVTALWETAEQQQIQLFEERKNRLELEERIRRLENAITN